MLDCKSLPALDSERNLDQNPTTKTFLLEGSNVDLWDLTTVQGFNADTTVLGYSLLVLCGSIK